MVRRLRETCGGCLGRRECGLKLEEFGGVRGGLDYRKGGNRSEETHRSVGEGFRTGQAV